MVPKSVQKIVFFGKMKTSILASETGNLFSIGNIWEGLTPRPNFQPRFKQIDENYHEWKLHGGCSGTVEAMDGKSHSPYGPARLFTSGTRRVKRRTCHYKIMQIVRAVLPILQAAPLEAAQLFTWRKKNTIAQAHFIDSGATCAKRVPKLYQKVSKNCNF